MPYNPKFMLLVLREIWKQPARFKRLKSISIEEIKGSSCNYCSLLALGTGDHGHRDPLKYNHIMSASTIKRMVTGTKFHMNLHLKIKVCGLEIGEKDYEAGSYKKMWQQLQQQDYFAVTHAESRDLVYATFMDTVD